MNRSKEAILTSAKQESALMRQNLDAYLENLTKYAAMLSSEVRNKLFLNSNRLETAYNTNAAAQVIGSEAHVQIKDIDFEEIRKSHILGLETIDLTDETVAIVKNMASALNHSIKNACGLMETLAYTDFSSESEVRELIDQANKSLEEALTAKEEMSKQEEIQRLLARLKELGYDPTTTAEAKSEEVVIVTKEEKDVTPTIKITLNGISTKMTVDEATDYIKRWVKSIKRKHLKAYDQSVIEYLRIIQTLSFVYKTARKDLFKKFEWDYNTFYHRFGPILEQENIKLYSKIRCTFDDN